MNFSSIYRLQLSSSFSFRKVIAFLPYFKHFGMEGIYFSPYFSSDDANSYAIIDSNHINPILGTEEDFNELCSQLKAHQLAHVIDVVPNHMGIMKGKNLWWQDVLRNGPYSQYASFFDINWNPEKQELQNKIFLPILHADYQDVINNKEIQLCTENGEFYFVYQGMQLPLCQESYPKENIDIINQNAHFLHDLLEKQHYHLGAWHIASPEINYRCFFSIHELAAICIEKDHVLQTHHKFLFDLIREDKIDCLRIDHPDGLYDPANYFKKLKEVSSLPIIVEKILCRDEKLPSSWDVEGSVGYEFLNHLGGLFVDQKSEQKLTSIYEEFIGKSADFEEILYASKKRHMHDYMINELEKLALALEILAGEEIRFRDLSRGECKEGLQEIIASFPYYRSYVAPKGLPSEWDRECFTIALHATKKRMPHLDQILFDFFAHVFLSADMKYRDVVLRFQQVTGSIMAKGLEDSSFYLYNRLLSLNEVGGDPLCFGYSVAEFHQYNQEKQQKWPLGFLPSSTHDSKRSEDARMRLHALSEMPEQWQEVIQSYPVSIDANSAYFIYQSLLAIWPKEGLDQNNREEFIERFWPLMEKSLREAGEYTNWTQHNDVYEKEVKNFIDKIITFTPVSSFLQKFLPFQKIIDRLGRLHSLSAQVIRLTSPGIVDVYQGSEELCYTLVDPDNRKDIDFERLQQRLQKLKEVKAESLYERGDYDSLKMWLLHVLLSFRKNEPLFFLHADYVPLEIIGPREIHLIAFMRRQEDRIVIVIVSRFYATLQEAIGASWQDCKLLVPFILQQRRFVDIFTQKEHVVSDFFSIEKVLSDLPFSVLEYISVDS